MTSETNQSEADRAEIDADETEQVEAERAETERVETDQLETGQAEAGQVDFYLLKDPSLSADHLACRLAMMAWEQRQQVFIVATGEAHLARLDELMWQYPPDRFLPHTLATDQNVKKSPVTMGLSSDLKAVSVVINLCPEAIPQATRFNRILEIVPFVQEQRDASRAKYKTYLQLGLKPQTHGIT